MLVPPLGHHTPEELAADVEAILIPPKIEVDIRMSSHKTKGHAIVRLEDELSSDLIHKQLHHLSMNSILSWIPSTLLHCFSSSLFKSPIETKPIPNTHQEAMASDNATQWKAAEDREMVQLQHLKVVELVPLPPKAQLLPTKWVYTIKKNGLFKARFIVRGDKQCLGVDFEDTFATIVHPKTFGIIVALVIANDLEDFCWDIISTLLNALIDELQIIYVLPPPGHETYDMNDALLV